MGRVHRPEPDVTGLFWWYLARAAGIVAWALLVAGLVWGVLLSTRVLRPHDRPAWLLDLHRWLAGLAVAMVGLHVGALVADTFVHFGPADVLVPLASGWHPVAVAFGVVAAYGLVAVQATSLAMRRLPRRGWRAVHLTSYGTVWLVSVHAGLAGSDAINPVYRTVALILVVAATGAAVTRLLARRGPPPRPASPPRPRSLTPTR
jgi:Ferric reductase like transmembrane component